MHIFFDEYLKSANENYYVKPEDVLQIYQMTKDMHKILTKYNIHYWIHAGTLLGAVRHGGLIPWDDDIDICIDKRESENFFSLRSIFNALNYEVMPFVFGYKIFPCTGKLTQYGYKYPWIDVMIWVEKGDKFMYDPALKPGYWFDTIFISKQDLFPLKEYCFGEIFLMGPNNPYNYLNYVYKDWEKFINISNHNVIGPQKILLQEEDKKPAVPFGPLKENVIP